jgi:hypothetical protein
MRNILLVAVGVWIGREIYMRLAYNQSKEREIKIRKRLEQFIKEQHPMLSPAEVANYIKHILN